MKPSPIEVLEQEHRPIQRVVGAMVLLAAALEAGKAVNPQTLRSIVEFMCVFGDQCHHGKEETHLFPMLGRRGVPLRGCPVGALTHEHAAGRTLVGQLAGATEAYVRGEPSAQTDLIMVLRSLADLYPNHIWKEDYLLFPMANKVLTEADQQELAQQFDQVEQSIGADTHRRFERLVEDIEREAQQR